MFTTARATAIALPVVLVFTLSGCSLLDASGDAGELTGTAACALGHTWELDVTDLADQVKIQLGIQGVVVQNVVGAGSQTLDWDVMGHVAMDTDYSFTITTAPAADQVLTVVETHAGEVKGAAYINGDVAIPRKWDAGGLEITVTADNNGTDVPTDELTYVIPTTDIDDSVGLELTCNGGALTIHPRGGKITLAFTKADQAG